MSKICGTSFVLTDSAVYKRWYRN